MSVLQEAGERADAFRYLGDAEELEVTIAAMFRVDDGKPSLWVQIVYRNHTPRAVRQFVEEYTEPADQNDLRIVGYPSFRSALLHELLRGGWSVDKVYRKDRLILRRDK